MAVLVLGLCGLAACTVGVVTQLLPRSFTRAQQRQIAAWEATRRWRITPAGRIFPPVIRYQLAGTIVGSARTIPLAARRAGIARQASCLAATDPAAGRLLDRHGCFAVLRATYLDATGSLVVTVGVAALPNAAAARTVAGRLAGPGGGARLPPGVRPASAATALTARFGIRQRQLSLARSSGPYVIISTAGYTDGRPRLASLPDPYLSGELDSLTSAVAGAVAAPLGAPVAPPRCPQAPGC